MRKTAAGKGARIEARVSVRQKDLLLRAASCQGRSLSEFVVAAAEGEAERVVRDHEVLKLSEADRRVFVESLLNPPEPNVALRRAFSTYRQGRK